MQDKDNPEINTDFLCKHPMFKGIGRDELERFKLYLGKELYSSGDTIIHEGERGACMYVLVNGAVEVLKKVVVDEEVNFERIALLEAGDTFGEMEFLDQQTRSATVRALDDCLVLTLAESTMWKVREIDQSTFTLILLNLAREVSKRLRRTDAYFAGSIFTLRKR